MFNIGHIANDKSSETVAASKDMICWIYSAGFVMVALQWPVDVVSAVDHTALWRGLDEYCQWQTFKANCKPDEVIVMKRAYYGRMQYGRCIKRDYGYVGCFTDVLSLADSRCSGQQSCQITVPDQLFDGSMPCPEDLKLYLMAEYTCIKVATKKFGRCHATITTPDFVTSAGRQESASTPLPMISQPVLSSRLAADTGCGSPQTPWIVEVPPGQRVNLTLVDFTITTTASSNVTASAHCHVYAIVKETRIGRTETICGSSVSPRPTPSSTEPETSLSNGGERRERQVYLSTGHVVEIRFMTSGKIGHYLMKYDAVGCPDLSPPVNGWWTRHDDRSASSGCGSPDSRGAVTWTCHERKWIGDGAMPSLNCNNTHLDPETIFGSRPSLSRVTALVIMASLAAAIGLLMLIVGLCIIRRRRAALLTRNSVLTSVHTVDGYYPRSMPGGANPPHGSAACAGGYMLPSGLSRSGQQQLQQQPTYMPGKEHAASCCSGSDGNDYAYVEDLLYSTAPFGQNRSGGGGGGVGHQGVEVCQPIQPTGGMPSSTFGAVHQTPSYSTANSSLAAWCPQSTGRLKKDLGVTAAAYGVGSGGRVVHQML